MLQGEKKEKKKEKEKKKKQQKKSPNQSKEIMSGMIPKIDAVSVLLLLATG